MPTTDPRSRLLTSVTRVAELVPVRKRGIYLACVTFFICRWCSFQGLVLELILLQVPFSRTSCTLSCFLPTRRGDGGYGLHCKACLYLFCSWPSLTTIIASITGSSSPAYCFSTSQTHTFCAKEECPRWKLQSELTTLEPRSPSPELSYCKVLWVAELLTADFV